MMVGSISTSDNTDEKRALLSSITFCCPSDQRDCKLLFLYLFIFSECFDSSGAK